MLKITLSVPLIIKEEDFAALMRIAAVPLTVEPYDSEAVVVKTRKPRTPKEAPAAETAAPAAETAAPAAETAAPAATKSKGRPAKSKATGMTPSDKAPDGAELLDRFSKLIDTSYDNALGLLEEFGVARFSDLKEEEFSAFAGKLESL